MDFEQLMRSIGHEYEHPYTEAYKVGFDHAVEKVGKAIHEVLGYEALAKVTAHIKSTNEGRQ